MNRLITDKTGVDEGEIDGLAFLFAVRAFGGCSCYDARFECACIGYVAEKCDVDLRVF